MSKLTDIIERHKKNMEDDFISQETEDIDYLLGLIADVETVEEFLPDNPKDTAPYFYYVTENEAEARESVFEGGKLMHRFVTGWEEVK